MTLDCKVYPLAPGEDDTLQKFLSENLDKGYICQSKSPYAFPFFFIKKKNSDLRPCYGSTDRSDRDGVLVESKSQQDYGRDVLELSRSSADLEGNVSNHSKVRSNRVELQTKSSLRLDSRYNAAFIHVQTVLRKRYISRYVSYARVLRIITITSHQSAERGHQSAHESVVRIVIKTGSRIESHESVLYRNRPTCRGQQARRWEMKRIVTVLYKTIVSSTQSQYEIPPRYHSYEN